MKLDVNELNVIKQSIEVTQFNGKDCIFVGNLLIKINKELEKEKKKLPAGPPAQ